MLVSLLLSGSAKAEDYIDSHDPSILETARQITVGLNSPVEKGVAIHDFVRDEIKFGFTGRLYDQRASEVLASKVGYCNTKSTLFVALLAAVEIPARQRFVDIHSDILLGFIDPGTRYVNHSCVEVFVNDRWVGTDSYIVDKALAEQSQSRLREENRVIGYGVHVSGVSTWDGTSDAYSQFLNNGEHPALTKQDHGIYRDVTEFYADGKRNNRLNTFTRLAFPLFAATANRRIASLRDSS